MSTAEPRAAHASSSARERSLARVVTYGMVALLAWAAVSSVEAWPITSYRLFSAVRTDRSVSLELVAVTMGGKRQVVSLGHGQLLATTRHQFMLLRQDPDAERQRKVRAWLRLADIDAATVEQVDLERVERRLDPHGGPATVVARTVVVETVL
ncbi:MAG: hypothetical protein ABIP03_14020 [Aquihabitans sp.]